MFLVETFFPTADCRVSLIVCSMRSARTLGLGVLEEVLLLIGLFNLSKGASIRRLQTARDVTRLLGHGTGLEDINGEGGGGGLENR